MAILIDTNIRGTINEGINLNQGRDFADLGAGHILNTRGFVDDTESLSLSIASGVITLTSGSAFVRYEKLEVANQNANLSHFMKCELTVPYTAPTPGANYFIWIQLNNAIITTSSNEIDGKDYFQFEQGGALPATGFFLPLFQVVGTTITDLREKRDACFRNMTIEDAIDVANLTVGTLTATTANITNLTAGAIILGVNDLQTIINNINTAISGVATLGTLAEAIAHTATDKALGVDDAYDIYGKESMSIQTDIVEPANDTTDSYVWPHAHGFRPEWVKVDFIADVSPVSTLDHLFTAYYHVPTNTYYGVELNIDNNRSQFIPGSLFRLEDGGGNDSITATITSADATNINVNVRDLGGHDGGGFPLGVRLTVRGRI